MLELKELRKKNGLTQDALAKLLGCTSRHIRYLESGERLPTPKMNKLVSELRKATPQK